MTSVGILPSQGWVGRLRTLAERGSSDAEARDGGTHHGWHLRVCSGSSRLGGLTSQYQCETVRGRSMLTAPFPRSHRLNGIHSTVPSGRTTGSRNNSWAWVRGFGCVNRPDARSCCAEIGERNRNGSATDRAGLEPRIAKATTIAPLRHPRIADVYNRAVGKVRRQFTRTPVDKPFASDRPRLGAPTASQIWWGSVVPQRLPSGGHPQHRSRGTRMSTTKVPCFL